MLSYGLPFLITVFLWWFSTGAILLLVGLPRRARFSSFAAALLIAAFAIYALMESRDQTGIAGAYIAFGAALALWGANEIGFLLGIITGSRKHAAPLGARLMTRFNHAAQSVIYHEIVLALSCIAIAVIVWGHTNRIGLYTFLILWGMRLSTKLNIFLGVPNITVQFLPAHIAYLTNFFNIKPMNYLFPFSVTLATLLAGGLIHAAIGAAPGHSEGVGLMLLASLAILGVLEHWFLVIPLPFGDLWAWGLTGRREPDENAGKAQSESALPMGGVIDCFISRQEPKTLP